MFDDVQHPKHYCDGRTIEPKDVMNEFGMNCQVGQAFKYLSRAGRKDDIIKDVNKALFWINEEIDRPIITVCQLKAKRVRLKKYDVRTRVCQIMDDWKIENEALCEAMNCILMYAYTSDMTFLTDARKYINIFLSSPNRVNAS